MTENPLDDQTQTNECTVTVSGPGVQISRPVTEEVLSAVVNLLFGGVASLPSRVATPVRDQAVATTGDVHAEDPGLEADEEDQPQNVREFIDKVEPKTFSQKICATGYFLLKVKKVGNEFSRDQVRTELINAHEDMPTNFPRDFTSALTSGFIATNPDTGLFYVPKAGATAVESNFTELPKKRTRRPAKKAVKAGDGE